MSVRSLFVLLVSSVIFAGCTTEKEEWKPLFNGKDLSGWDTYLGPRYDTLLKKTDSIPVGLNNDPSGVFKVVRMGDENVLRISGENFGGISTSDQYENYHLQLQFRWGELKWAPKKKNKRDSGLMYDAVGPHGADGGFWMRSHEFQIEEGDCGDYWACAGAMADIKVRKDANGDFVYDESGELMTFGIKSPIGRHCVKYPDAEKPSGEWNTLDLYCLGSTSIHVVNGKVNMVLHNSRQLTENREIPLTKGKIQLQSEGSEIYYRDIKICQISKLPDLPRIGKGK